MSADLDKAVERAIAELKRGIAAGAPGIRVFQPEIVILLNDHARLSAELAKVEEALDLALDYLGELEPGDSRAVSNEYVAMLGVLCGVEPNKPGEDLEIIRAAKKARIARQALGETND